MGKTANAFKTAFLDDSDGRISNAFTQAFAKEDSYSDSHWLQDSWSAASAKVQRSWSTSSTKAKQSLNLPSTPHHVSPLIAPQPSPYRPTTARSPPTASPPPPRRPGSDRPPIRPSVPHLSRRNSNVSSQVTTRTKNSISASATCNVCFEERSPAHFPPRAITQACIHPLNTCSPCLRQHISSQIESRAGSHIRCVCNAAMSTKDVRRHAAPTDFARYCELAALRAMESCENFVWCPYGGCTGGQIHDAGNAAPIVTCLACHKKYCFTHRVAWHAGFTCNEYDMLSPTEQINAIEEAENPPSQAQAETRRAQAAQAFQALQAEEVSRQELREETARREERRQRLMEERQGEMFVHNSGAKPCPRCRFMSQKVDGCKHMTCAKCSCQYCWNCLSIWAYGHLNVNC